MTQIITFQGQPYVQASYDRPLETLVLVINEQHPTTLVPLFNALVEDIGAESPVSAVKRFADARVARRRTWDLLQWYKTWSEMVDPQVVPLPEHILASIVPRQEGLIDRPLPIDVNKGATHELAETLIAREETRVSKASTQGALRANPPAIDPAKDAEMPALRRALKPMELKPKKTVYPRVAGSKQALLVDLLARPEGATFGELYDTLASTGKPWKGVTIRSGLAWDINHIAGYGVVSELFNGEEFATIRREYEAKRLGMVLEGPLHPDVFGHGGGMWTQSPGYDPELKLAVYRLAYPKGMTEPLPHTPRKTKA